MRMILATATILCILTSCKTGKSGTTKAKDINKLNGSWELIYISGSSDSLGKLYPGKKPMMRIDPAGKQVNGNTGCNSFAGPVTLDGNKLSFDQPLVLTKMFCAGNGENTFLGALKKINAWTVNDGTMLNFLQDDMAVMRFSKVQ